MANRMAFCARFSFSEFFRKFVSPTGSEDAVSREMEDLAHHIRERLRNHKFCIVFDNRLRLAFPRTDDSAIEKQKRQIEAFAARNGWSVKIHDPGLRVVFRKLENSRTSTKRAEKISA
jgi:hypothetical protein